MNGNQSGKSLETFRVTEDDLRNRQKPNKDQKKAKKRENIILIYPDQGRPRRKEPSDPDTDDDVAEKDTPKREKASRPRKVQNFVDSDSDFEMKPRRCGSPTCEFCLTNDWPKPESIPVCELCQLALKAPVEKPKPVKTETRTPKKEKPEPVLVCDLCRLGLNERAAEPPLKPTKPDKKKQTNRETSPIDGESSSCEEETVAGTDEEEDPCKVLDNFLRNRQKERKAQKAALRSQNQTKRVA